MVELCISGGNIVLRNMCPDHDCGQYMELVELVRCWRDEGDEGIGELIMTVLNSILSYVEETEVVEEAEHPLKGFEYFITEFYLRANNNSRVLIISF